MFVCEVYELDACPEALVVGRLRVSHFSPNVQGNDDVLACRFLRGGV